MPEKSQRTPSYTLKAMKNYQTKLISHRFQAQRDSERGKLMETAKNDDHFLEKFWQFMAQEYGKTNS